MGKWSVLSNYESSEAKASEPYNGVNPSGNVLAEVRRDRKQRVDLLSRLAFV